MTLNFKLSFNYGVCWKKKKLYPRGKNSGRIRKQCQPIKSDPARTILYSRRQAASTTGKEHSEHRLRQTARSERRAPSSLDGGPERRREAAAKHFRVVQSPCRHCKCWNHRGRGCAVFSRLLLYFASFWLLGHRIQIRGNGLCCQGILTSSYLNYRSVCRCLIQRNYRRWISVNLILKFPGLVLLLLFNLCSFCSSILID